MYQQPQYQNKTDNAAGDFFHSKTWKIILIVWFSLMGLACCIGVLLMLGFGGAIMSLIAGFFQVINSTPQILPTLRP
jgi:hypothetical protein